MSDFPIVSRAPDMVSFTDDYGAIPADAAADTRWTIAGAECRYRPDQDGGLVVSAMRPLRSVVLRWRHDRPSGWRYLGDAWERADGDLEWRGEVPERLMPWYFVSYQGTRKLGIGVAVQPAAFCCWQADSSGITLIANIQNGGGCVLLDGRELLVARIIEMSDDSDASVFQFSRRFCSAIAEGRGLGSPKLFGVNDWYLRFGNSSLEQVLANSRSISSITPPNLTRPFSIIDDGWQSHDDDRRSPWRHGNSKFGGLAEIAEGIASEGCKPGIWMRPLNTSQTLPRSWFFEPKQNPHVFMGGVLDPSIPEVVGKICEDLACLAAAGFELVKIDVLMFDIYAASGSDLRLHNVEGGWGFADRSRTSAEIIRDLYKRFLAACNGSLLQACGVPGHLVVGSCHALRIAGSVGRRWERTRRYAINGLAHRLPQNGSFFRVDPDCIYVGDSVPERLWRQQTELFSRSDSAMIFSADMGAFSNDQLDFLSRSISTYVNDDDGVEPEDWTSSTSPSHWRSSQGAERYDWIQAESVTHIISKRGDIDGARLKYWHFEKDE